jgi:hypothetical protein
MARHPQENQLSSCDPRKMVRVLARRAKIGKRVFPHLFRHSLATNLLNRGVSLIMIKDQLGHAFIDSTTIYVTSMPFRTRSEFQTGVYVASKKRGPVYTQPPYGARLDPNSVRPRKARKHRAGFDHEFHRHGKMGMSILGRSRAARRRAFLMLLCLIELDLDIAAQE